MLRALFGSGLYMAGLGLFAAGRRAAGAAHRRRPLRSCSALVFVVGQMAWLLPGTWGEWIAKLMPGNAGAAVATPVSFNPELLGPWTGFAVFAGEVAVAARRWRWWSSAAATPDPSRPCCPRPARPGHSGAVTSPIRPPRAAAAPTEFLALLGRRTTPPPTALLDGLPEVRDLVFLGAGLTAVARAEARAPAAGAARPGQHPPAAARRSCATPTAATRRACATGCGGPARRSCCIRAQQAIADRVAAEARPAIMDPRPRTGRSLVTAP